MRTATKLKPAKTVTTTKTADQIQGRDVIASLGGNGVLQEIERANKTEATAYAPSHIMWRKRLQAFLRRAEKQFHVVPELQPFDGLNIHGAAHGINFCIERLLLNNDVEQYVTHIPLRAVCDLLVEIAREVLAKPENHYIDGVKWYLNGMEFEYGSRGDYSNGEEPVTTITRSDTDRRHCHTVDRY